MRDRVGQAIGQSDRNAKRYPNVLRAPMEVQRAVRAGRLTLTVAEKFPRLLTKEKSRLRGGIEVLAGREGEIVRDFEDLSAEIRTLGRFSKFSRGLRERRDRMKDE